MTAKFSVVLMYEPDVMRRGVPLGMTDDMYLKVLVKRQLIKEATEALREAEELGDNVLITSFQRDLDKLKATLDLVIPPEMEALYLAGMEQ